MLPVRCQLVLFGQAVCLVALWGLPDAGASDRATGPGQQLAPIRFSDLEQAGFQKLRFQTLKDAEREAFYQVYPPDEEMLSRVTVGMRNQPLGECISGEPPAIQVALQEFPLHYPMLGRMTDVTGTLQWQNERLVLRTARQSYHVDEYHILYRLEQMGFTPESDSTRARLTAVWTVNRIDALRLIYVEKIELR